MTFDPLSFTYRDPAPLCPLCGAPPRVPAIMPASSTECSRCALRVPSGEWGRVAAALSSTTPTRLVRAQHVRDDAIRALRMAQEDAQQLAATLAQQIATLERAREVEP
mgnify:FL=1